MKICNCKVDSSPNLFMMTLGALKLRLLLHVGLAERMSTLSFATGTMATPDGYVVFWSFDDLI